MMRDDLDAQAEWIAIAVGEHRTLLGPGRIPRAVDIDRVLALDEQLARMHEGMADLYRRHRALLTEHLQRLEDTHDDQN
jgi:hypothetical protein